MKMKIITIAVSILFSVCTYASSFTFPVKKWKTSAGIPVVFYEAKEVPMLDISIAFAAGSAYDGAAFGLSALTTGLLNEGNGGLSSGEIAQRLADTGAQFQSSTSRDMTVLMLKTLTAKEFLDKATSIFSLIIAHPDFPQAAFTREQNQQLVGISQKDESPELVAEKMFYKLLYKTHPYAHPIDGEKSTVANLKLEDVKTFYKKYFVANNAIIVLVGAIDKNTAHQLAEKLTKDIPTGKKAEKITQAPPLTEEVNIEVKFPSSQTVMRVGQVGIDYHNPNYFPLTVGNYILGGGTLVSLLSTEVREKRGLTYGIYSQFISMPGLGPFLISFSTKTTQANLAMDIMRKTLKQYIDNGPSDLELTAAKKYLIGSFPLSLSSNKSIAELLLRIAFYQLPDDYLETYIERINQVTKESIKKAFSETVHPNKMLQISVGQQ
jgi:zinc protease